MAKATANVLYRLDLTAQEAGALRALCYHIGGRLDGPRGYIDNIAEALDSADCTIYSPTAAEANSHFKDFDYLSFRD